MLLELGEVKSNVTSYLLNDLGLIYFNNLGLYVNEKQIQLLGIERVVNLNKKVLIYTEDQIFILKENNKVEKFINVQKGCGVYAFIDNEEIISSYRTGDFRTTIARINFKTNIVKWSLFAMINKAYDSYMFEYDDLKIAAYSIDSGMLKWIFTIPENDSRSGLIIFNQNLILIPTESSRLYALDKDSGAVVWMVEDTLDFWSVDHEQHRLVGVTNRYIHLIDLDSGISEKVFIEREVSNYDISILSHLGTYHEGLYYFVSNKYEKGIVKIGCLDISTGKILCIEDLARGESTYYGASKPVISNHRFYTLDTNKTLHIYSIIKRFNNFK